MVSENLLSDFRRYITKEYVHFSMEIIRERKRKFRFQTRVSMLS